MRLGPWHLDIAVTPEVSTRVWADEAGRPLASPRELFQRTLRSIYPDGLQGRSVLDCGCNSGGYAFWAKELGAGRCFGFDAREQWITQAQFLLEQRGEEEMRFEVADLYSLPELERFDVTVFSGLFYHLPDRQRLEDRRRPDEGDDPGDDRDEDRIARRLPLHRERGHRASDVRALRPELAPDRPEGRRGHPQLARLSRGPRPRPHRERHVRPRLDEPRGLEDRRPHRRRRDGLAARDCRLWRLARLQA